MNYSLYLFDFDYTLADSAKGIVMCFQHVLRHNGFENISEDRIKRTIGITLEDAFIKLTGVQDQEQLVAFRKEYVKKADKVMVNNTVIFPGVLETLQCLKNEGAQTGIISTKYRYRIKETIDLYHMENLIDCILGGEDVDHAKPNPEGLEKVILGFEIPKEKVLYIGDSLVDAETAKNAGVDFAAVTTGMTTKEDFKGMPYVMIMKSLKELI
ncbi:MAG: HAD-IA family hydrolase [Eubacterium sp.]